MILTKEQVELRLCSSKNLIKLVDIEREKLSKQNEVIIKDSLNHQGNKGTKNFTPEERVEIGVAARLLGNEAAAELLGVSERAAQDLKLGWRNHSNDNNN